MGDISSQQDFFFERNRSRYMWLLTGLHTHFQRLFSRIPGLEVGRLANHWGRHLLRIFECQDSCGMPGGQKSRSFNVLPSNRKLKLHHNKQWIHVRIHDSTESPSTETLNSMFGISGPGNFSHHSITTKNDMPMKLPGLWYLATLLLESPVTSRGYLKKFSTSVDDFVVSRIDCIKLVQLHPVVDGTVPKR